MKSEKDVRAALATLKDKYNSTTDVDERFVMLGEIRAMEWALDIPGTLPDTYMKFRQQWSEQPLPKRFKL